MKSILKCLRVGSALLAVTLVLVGPLTNHSAAQPAPPAATVTALPAATISALQAALNKQGIAVKADGILNDETRAAIRKYQSLHHLSVTGEPDKATLDKLGVTVAQGTTVPEQSAPPTAGQGQMQAGMMMGCPMMQGQMQEMMKMMQGMMAMMKMMQGMQGQMQPGMQPGQMAPQMQPGAK